MEKYSQEFQDKKDITEKIESGKEGNLTENEKAMLNISLPHDYYEYKIKGVVIHNGTADYGHYTSLIYDRENASSPDYQRWYEFNDSRVRRFNPDLMQMEAFGGRDEEYFLVFNMLVVGL